MSSLAPSAIASTALALGILVCCSPARAAVDEPADTVSPAPVERDVRNETPILAYTYRAAGVSARSIGVQAYGLLLAADKQNAVPGGGLILYGSPVDRLTLVGDGGRDVFGNFAPSAAVLVRLFGQGHHGLSLGALGKYKVEGFGIDPGNPVESELEGGLLLSFTKSGFSVDANAIAGVGLGGEGEVDTEGRLRLGLDVGERVRVGLDGQVRVRVAGEKELLGGRTWDFAAGPQVLFAWSHFFASATAGPATLGVVSGFGFSSLVAVGGTTL